MFPQSTAYAFSDSQKFYFGLLESILSYSAIFKGVRAAAPHHCSGQDLCALRAGSSSVCLSGAEIQSIGSPGAQAQDPCQLCCSLCDLE